MKLNKKNHSSFILIVFLVTLAGSFAWFILEIIFKNLGIPFSLSTGKIGFDIEIISFYLNINPGTVLGMIGGYFVFKAI